MCKQLDEVIFIINLLVLDQLLPFQVDGIDQYGDHEASGNYMVIGLIDN